MNDLARVRDRWIFSSFFKVLDMSHSPILISPLAEAKQTIPDSFFQDFPNLKVLG